MYYKGRYKEVLEVEKHYHRFCDKDADRKMDWYVSYSKIAIAEQENPKPKPKAQPTPAPNFVRVPSASEERRRRYRINATPTQQYILYNGDMR